LSSLKLDAPLEEWSHHLVVDLDVVSIGSHSDEPLCIFFETLAPFKEQKHVAEGILSHVEPILDEVFDGVSN